MPAPRNIARRLKLRVFLFAFLVVFGSLPLIVSSITTITQNREGLETQEMVGLVREAGLISQELSDFLLSIRRQLRQFGVGLTAIPSRQSVGEEAQRQWIERYVSAFQQATSRDFGTRITDLANGRQFGTPVAAVQTVLDESLNAARQRLVGSYTLINRGREQLPLVVISEPIPLGDGETAGELAFVVQAVTPLRIPETGGDIFILDVAASGQVLWSARTEAELVKEAVASTELVRSYVQFPQGIRADSYSMRVGRNTQAMIGQIGPLADTGWAVLVHKPKAAAFTAVRQLIKTTVFAALLIVALALVFAAVATRLIGQPIERLAKTSQQIAAGNFGQRVEPSGIGAEISDLADSFNQMSGHVEDYVRRLRDAAQINRELFIGSIRAFLAAIEAKEPYTRGHSERVASFSQGIARRLRLGRDFQEKIWVAGLLHDVGKIGIEDRVLNKGDVLTAEEYEEMKRHPTIGAEIMSSIDQLRDMIPAIRWHHEKWNGKGYPDGLSGEQIPIMARIVAVADTFDAVTTQRVYQDPLTPEEAVEIVKKLDGSGFDPAVVAAFLAAFNDGEIEVVPAVSTGPRRQPVSLAEAAAHS